MSKQKKVFLAISAVFILAVIGFTIHIFSVTTRPGKKAQLRQRIETRLETDSTRTDSVASVR